MKKLRGFTRKTRLVAQACTMQPPLSEAHLRRYHYDYAKLGNGPLHQFRQDGRQPPQVVRQLGVVWLLQTFHRWQKLLSQINEPFYAAIWLAEADFTPESQVVAATQQRISRYERIFGEAVPNGPPLPPEYRALIGADQLTWTTHRRHEWLDAEDFPHGWPARLLRRYHIVHTLADGRDFLIVPRGWVWVGRAASLT